MWNDILQSRKDLAGLMPKVVSVSALGINKEKTEDATFVCIQYVNVDCGFLGVMSMLTVEFSTN